MQFLFTFFSSLFKGLLSLKKLKMQNNSVSIIDTNAFTLLPKVEEINLSRNNISDILVLDDNYMLLSVFYRCEKLQKLDLSYNKINRIFSDWTTQPPPYFRRLDLSHNEIERIYVSYSMCSIQFFQFDSNQNFFPV